MAMSDPPDGRYAAAMGYHRPARAQSGRDV